MKDFETVDLVTELISREGVEEHTVEPFEEETITVIGPARILVITD